MHCSIWNNYLCKTFKLRCYYNLCSIADDVNTEIKLTTMHKSVFETFKKEDKLFEDIRYVEDYSINLSPITFPISLRTLDLDLDFGAGFWTNDMDLGLTI